MNTSTNKRTDSVIVWNIGTAPIGEDLVVKLTCGSVLVDAVRQYDGDWWWCPPRAKGVFFSRDKVLCWRKQELK